MCLCWSSRCCSTFKFWVNPPLLLLFTCTCRKAIDCSHLWILNFSQVSELWHQVSKKMVLEKKTFAKCYSDWVNVKTQEDCVENMQIKNTWDVNTTSCHSIGNLLSVMLQLLKWPEVTGELLKPNDLPIGNCYQSPSLIAS